MPLACIRYVWEVKPDGWYIVQAMPLACIRYVWEVKPDGWYIVQAMPLACIRYVWEVKPDGWYIYSTSHALACIRYVWEVKPDGWRVLYLTHLPYLGMVLVFCVTAECNYRVSIATCYGMSLYSNLLWHESL